MISLAALRYRSVLAAKGGPIERIEEGRLQIAGKEFSQANAHLKSELVPKRAMEIYGDADGTGMHRSPMVARHIAISEALERWAYYDTVYSAVGSAYGFHIDESSNGMAAFPGLFGISARKAARLEAIERYCLLNWWEQKIDGSVSETSWAGVNAISFSQRWGGVAVILFKKSELGFYSYSHAAGHSFLNACERALIELARHEWAIQGWIHSGKTTPPKNVFERRALFFSSNKGHELFRDRLMKKVGEPLREPELVCDSEIPGPWSDYATVWRVLFQPPSARFMGSDEDYFFW